MVECSFTKYVVVDSSPVALTWEIICFFVYGVDKNIYQSSLNAARIKNSFVHDVKYITTYPHCYTPRFQLAEES